MSDDVDRVKQRVDIVDLVSEQVTLKRAGRNFKGLCPFHDDKNPSFDVNPELGRYRCWSCGAAGDVFNWIMETRKVEFPEALRILADRAGVELTGSRQAPDKEAQAEAKAAMEIALDFFVRSLKSDAEATAYLTQRGLDEETIRRWELGWAPAYGDLLASELKKKGISLVRSRELFLVDQDASGGYYDRFRGRVIFPIRDLSGRLVGFGGRIIGAGEPKYLNSGDTPLFKKSTLLYGMHRAKGEIGKRGYAIMTEGYMDVIACERQGFPHTVATLGTSPTEQHATVLKRWTERVILLFDQDEAGQKAAERAIEIFKPKGLDVRVAKMPAGEDPDSVLKSHGAPALQRVIDAAIPSTEFRLERLESQLSVDNPKFWEEAVRVVAAEPLPLERDRLLMPLSGKYPELRDAKLAFDELRKMVLVAQRKSKKRGPAKADTVEETSAPAHPTIRPPRWLGPERAILYAWLEVATRQAAHMILRQADFWVTKDAAGTAKVLSETFGEDPPLGGHTSWLPKITHETVSQWITDILIKGYEPVSAEELLEAARKLQAKRSRDLTDLKAQTLSSDDLLKQATDRLRKSITYGHEEV